MVFWERRPDLAAHPPVVQDFAEIWQRAEVSTTVLSISMSLDGFVSA
jgi:hypothetical protein